MSTYEDLMAAAAAPGTPFDRRFYRSATLAAAPARTGWVEPDLEPFPWR
jgi:hypothetical protein